MAATPYKRPPPEHCLCKDVTWQVRSCKSPIGDKKRMVYLERLGRVHGDRCICGYQRHLRELEAESEPA